MSTIETTSDKNMETYYRNNGFKYCEWSGEWTCDTINTDSTTHPMKDELNVKFIFFYADECSESNAYRPKWNSFKTAIDGKTIEGNIVRCLEYECTDPSDHLASLIEKYEVSEYPSVKLVSNCPNKTDTMALLEPILNYRSSLDNPTPLVNYPNTFSNE